jgi:anti-sigma regulatory factor (Ser/Thr protein kinase)
VPSTEPQIAIVLAGESASVTEARHSLLEVAGKVHADAFSVGTAVSEAVANSVIHAFRGRERAGQISIQAEVVDNQLVVAVSDDGTGMRPNPADGGLGLGLPLIGRLTDSYEVVSDDSGTVVRMRFALSPADSDRGEPRSVAERAGR